MKRSGIALAFAAVCAAAAASPAGAAIMTYGSASEFLGKVSGASTESFDSVMPTSGASLTFTSFRASETTLGNNPDNSVSVTDRFTDSNLKASDQTLLEPTSPANLLVMMDDIDSVLVLDQFVGTKAVGFYVQRSSDRVDPNGADVAPFFTIQVDTADGQTDELRFSLGRSNNGNTVEYVGILSGSSPIEQVRILADHSVEGFVAIDDVTTASDVLVPLPATALLLGGAFGLLALRRRRQPA